MIKNSLKIFFISSKQKNWGWGLGIGDWGLGIGDWAQSPIPNFSFYKYKFVN